MAWRPWRPKNWEETRTKYQQQVPLSITTNFEAGADAIVEALKAKAEYIYPHEDSIPCPIGEELLFRKWYYYPRLNIKPETPCGWMVFIPDETQEGAKALLGQRLSDLGLVGDGQKE